MENNNNLNSDTKRQLNGNASSEVINDDAIANGAVGDNQTIISKILDRWEGFADFVWFIMCSIGFILKVCNLKMWIIYFISRLCCKEN